MSEDQLRPSRTEREAQELEKIGHGIAEMVGDKARAYGGAHNRQGALWAVLLEDYREPNGQYRLPMELMYHIPRLTRVFDRVLRIIANPKGDPMGEDPWRDLAGDALAGVQMPRGPECGHELGRPWGGHCERPAGHQGPCERWGEGGIVPPRGPLVIKERGLEVEPLTVFEPLQDAQHEVADPHGTITDYNGVICGRSFRILGGELRQCALVSGHEGSHVDDRGRAEAR